MSSSNPPPLFSQQSKATQNFPIVLSNVSKRYGTQAAGKWALRDINFTIYPGIFGLLGRNGAGKTTLLQMLATLLDPTTGSIQIGPYDVRRERGKVRSLLGFLPQEQGFYAQLTVAETLRYLATLQGLTGIGREVERVLDAVNLSDRAKTRVGTLSGGMRRRLGLAQALLGNPYLLIVDEPTTGLDPVEQQRFRMLLGALGAQGNQTIILSTHIIADVATIAGHLAVLEQGQLVFHGTVQELAARASGYSWLWRTTMENLERVRQQRSMIVTSLTPITDGTAAPNEILARIEGERPDAHAQPCEPTLEDGYFSIIGGTEHDEDKQADLVARLRAERKRW